MLTLDQYNAPSIIQDLAPRFVASALLLQAEVDARGGWEWRAVGLGHPGSSTFAIASKGQLLSAIDQFGLF
jgi:hypothetical protein